MASSGSATWRAAHPDPGRPASATDGPFAEHGTVEPEAARWLWLEAFEWLRLAGCDRVVAALVEDEPAVEQAAALGLRPVTRLRRGWTLHPAVS